MATSTVPALKAALLARLQARTGLTGVQITWGRPHGSLEREWIMLGDTRSVDPTGQEKGGQSTAALGRQRREERYVLDVWVSVLKPALEEQSTVTARAYALVAEIENELRADGSVGGAVRWALITDASDLSEALAKNAQERESQVRVEIACAQRI